MRSLRVPVAVLFLELLLLFLALSLFVLALSSLLKNCGVIVHSAPVVIDAMLLSCRRAWSRLYGAGGYGRHLRHPDGWRGVPCLWPPDGVRIMEVGRYTFT
jgi:hypothetical protein